MLLWWLLRLLLVSRDGRHKKPARGGPKAFFPEPTSAKLLSISLFYGSLI